MGATYIQKYDVLEVTQPIGTFYLSSIPANVLIRTVKSARRSLSEGVQRDASKLRIKQIATFCGNHDAVFPTPIIVSVEENKAWLERNKICFHDNQIMGDILDGQHRLLGLQDSDNAGEFTLPVVFMFNLTAEEKAYIFSIINSKQTKVSPSLLFDLFGLTDKRSPQKTAHDIARALNNMPSSPFCNRLKMLGKKEANQDAATLSQGTFAQSIMLLYSKYPDKDREAIGVGKELENDATPLRQFFVQGLDDAILKIILNFFKALKEAYPVEWKEPTTNILWKSTGFRGIIKALPQIIGKGISEGCLTYDYFHQYIGHFKDSHSDWKFDSDHYGSGEAGQNKLCKDFLSPFPSFSFVKGKDNFENKN